MDVERIADIFRRWAYLQADIDSFDRLAPFPHRDLDAVKDAPEAKPFRDAYMGKIGVEFMHMPFPDRCDWIAERMEGERPVLDQRRVLKRILINETFEKFLHTRYVGSKRFSLDGIAALIPLIDAIMDETAEGGAENVLLAMAHRGRLNVMHHIAETLTETIIAAFEDVDPKSMLGSNDVKYHMGATGTYVTAHGKNLAVDIAANPSHLEAIAPVLLGRIRARQQRLNDIGGRKVMGIVMHGDAAFAGQGIAAETLNFSELNGFSVGGVIHIIINNLIGFTTVPDALHSSRYASDIAKRLNIPIFHVNAESPDDVVFVGQLAEEYRREFKTDVVIDLVGYRRFGHQEQDDPTITSPVLYDRIKAHPLLFEQYAEEIGIAEEDIKQLQESSVEMLEEGLKKGRSMTKAPTWSKNPDYWDPYVGGYYEESLEVDTSVPAATLAEVAKTVTTFDDSFTIHPKVKRVFEQRAEMGQGKRLIDWGMAESLAFGSLLQQKVPVRLVGQDSRRGTFSHRHAVLYDHENGVAHTPVAPLVGKDTFFEVYDSMLSEAAAVAYEYGFSRDYPEALVLWEAQFGDFVNGAQIILDQFVVAGEDKWSLLSGLVFLLPHGFEGAGPEHSSARLERFLQSAAEDNIQVVSPSSAGQYFHLLRRQALRSWRKPLIVMTPKSMLRSQMASSPLEVFTEGKFQEVISDAAEFPEAERLIFCTGKITHELRKDRDAKKDTNTAIASVEQLYPLPEKAISSIIKSMPNLRLILWVQEEPKNMGALGYINPHLKRLSNGIKVSTVRRSESASPATGSPKAHALEQQALLNLAFAKHQ